ncbi:MAG: 2-oxoacid:acceptor oxidoreductase family protein [Chloroflexi bacterium]|nr:2-oxoacid:acceptor oxidoreductase family protein [Chloroflexota bacterium]
MSSITEIRWHGRAGQGIVTAGEVLAEAALEEGKYFQAFPDYGPERMGAPIKSFTRISSSPIDIHCQIQAPDVVVVVDPTLVGVVDVTDGLKEDGVILVNTPKTPGDIRAALKVTGQKVFTVDATRIATETIGRPIPNTPMLGALVKATGVVSKESVINLTRERLGAKLKEEVVAANLRAIERAYEEVENG